uniref:Uncharacterized protein n=2 Tax=Guillardia theta TaxID=55529 RepID=A0A7S4NIR7_GUITH|mmetsp:Transcript_2309/g.7011  ORF Transcript_2309/g.7011 Transcript_2309/m.7011 type:complete len:531 (+) Transcript_2309:502-2094(+)
MKAMRGVQLAAKGVGDAFTGGRDLNSLLHALYSTTVSVEAYFNQPAFQKVLPQELCTWASSLCGEAKEAHERLRKKIEQMEKDGVRGAAESSFHALSSAAGAITGIAMLDVGRHIADELVSMTAALNDILARATRLVTLHNSILLGQIMEKFGDQLADLPVVQLDSRLTKFETDNVRPRLWVKQVEDGSVVAGEKLIVSWETVGNVPVVNVRLKNCMGVETSRGKTVLRITSEQGELNSSPMETTIPLDFMPGKYTLAVSDPANNIRGMTFVSVLRPVSVAEISEPSSGIGRTLSWRIPTWNRGSVHTIRWKMHRGKASLLVVSIAIAQSSDGPWRVLRGASEMKFKVPDNDKPSDRTDQELRSPAVQQVADMSLGGDFAKESAANRNSVHHSDSEDDKDASVVWGPQTSSGEETEWFLEERASSKSSHGKQLVSSFGNTFSGFLSPWHSDSHAHPPPKQHSKPVAEPTDDFLLSDSHCLDCSFDWFVPIELEPGKYFFRIIPVGASATHRWGEREQHVRCKDSGFVHIS